MLGHSQAWSEPGPGSGGKEGRGAGRPRREGSPGQLRAEGAAAAAGAVESGPRECVELGLQGLTAPSSLHRDLSMNNLTELRPGPFRQLRFLEEL